MVTDKNLEQKVVEELRGESSEGLTLRRSKSVMVGATLLSVALAFSACGNYSGRSDCKDTENCRGSTYSGGGSHFFWYGGGAGSSGSGGSSSSYSAPRGGHSSGAVHAPSGGFSRGGWGGAHGGGFGA